MSHGSPECVGCVLWLSAHGNGPSQQCVLLLRQRFLLLQTLTKRCHNSCVLTLTWSPALLSHPVGADEMLGPAARAAHLCRQRGMGAEILLLTLRQALSAEGCNPSSPERGGQVRSLIGVCVARWGLPNTRCWTLERGCCALCGLAGSGRSWHDVICNS